MDGGMRYDRPTQWFMKSDLGKDAALAAANRKAESMTEQEVAELEVTVCMAEPIVAPARFSVTRASHFRDDGAPCVGAIPGEERGSYRQWFVEIGSLTDLVLFIKREGKIILDYDLSITIYDDYVE